MKCIIVGSGPSAKGFKPPKDIPIIAVNGVIEWIKRVDYWFTLDPSEANRNRMNNQRPDTEYHAAVPDNVKLPEGVTRWCRVESKKKRSDYWMRKYKCVLTLNKEPGKINTGNSAWGALGLAYHLGFKDVLLIGVDGTSDERIEGGKPNTLSHLPELFKSARRQVKLRSAGKLEGIKKVKLKAWLKT